MIHDGGDPNRTLEICSLEDDPMSGFRRLDVDPHRFAEQEAVALEVRLLRQGVLAGGNRRGRRSGLGGLGGHAG